MPIDVDAEIRRVIGDMNDFTSDLIRQMGVEIVAELTERTPVDTGWAAANWVPNINVPFDTDLSFIVSEEDRRAEVGNAEADQQLAIGSLITGEYDHRRGPIFISNNVPYIGVLNTGTSNQAPAMFIEMSIEQGLLNLATPG